MKWHIQNGRLVEYMEDEPQLTTLWHGIRSLGSAKLDQGGQIVFHWRVDEQHDEIKARQIHFAITRTHIDNAITAGLSEARKKHGEASIDAGGAFHTTAGNYIGGITVLPAWSPQQTLLLINQENTWRVYPTSFFWLRTETQAIEDIVWLTRIIGKADTPILNIVIPDWGIRYPILRQCAVTYQQRSWDRLSDTERIYYLIRADQMLRNPLL